MQSKCTIAFAALIASMSTDRSSPISFSDIVEVKINLRFLSRIEQKIFSDEASRSTITRNYLNRMRAWENVIPQQRSPRFYVELIDYLSGYYEIDNSPYQFRVPV